MAFQFMTARGTYRLTEAAPLEADASGPILTVGMERADGIERVVLRFRIGRALVSTAEAANGELLIARLGPWIERGFEQIREAALKSVRSEKRLMEVSFDAENRGPF